MICGADTWVTPSIVAVCQRDPDYVEDTYLDDNHIGQDNEWWEGDD